ncbi:MAG TPA: hypothetical protein VK464_13330, partial [Symbiobacteriaceae bacterium]|nr:hypothetical protein [Symbiobacteriaceae bacterium]
APAAGSQPAGQAQAAQAGQTDPNWTPEKDTAFAKRLESERAKIRAQAEADVKKQHDADIRLGQMLRQQGYDPSQVLTQYEQQQLQRQAQQAGMNPQVYGELQALRTERESLQQERRLSSLQQEAATLRQEFGATFDQHAQAAIDRASQTGESLEEAFFAIGRRDILKSQQGRTEQQVLAQVTGRDGKAPVLATGGPQVTPQTDVSKMPKKDFEALLKEVKAGRRNSL